MDVKMIQAIEEITFINEVFHKAISHLLCCDSSSLLVAVFH
jgi:hypothetical protein